MLRLAKPMNYIALSPSRDQVTNMRAAEQVPLIMEPEVRIRALAQIISSVV